MNCPHLLKKTVFILGFALFLSNCFNGHCTERNGESYNEPLPRFGILPIQALGIDYKSLATIENMLKAELQSQLLDYAVLGSYGLNINEYDACSELECALEIGREKDLDLVLVCTMSRLGERIYFQYLLADVNESRMILTDNTTTAGIEDMEPIVHRVALSVAKRKNLADVAEVGAIMEDETLSSNRRKGLPYSGLNFGYLYPKVGYDDVDRSFYYEFYRGIETAKFNVGFNLAYNRGIAAGLFANHLLTSTDFCPFIGGGLGFHWAIHDPKIHDYREDGFQVMVGGGLRFLRTYDFQVQVGIRYSWTFNDYDDEAMLLTLGFSK
jgi:hypothetical protein